MVSPDALKAFVRISGNGEQPSKQSRSQLIDRNNLSKRFTGPLFVVGSPRSGTKLLRALLNRHPLIYIPIFETEFLPWLARNTRKIGDLSVRTCFEQFYKEISRTDYMANINKKFEKIEREFWYDACERYTVAEVFEILIRHDTNTLDKRDAIWGDKTPSYINHVDLLLALYPQARFLHIVRDVRDVCLSVKNAWGKSLYRAAQRWVDDQGRFQTTVKMYPGQSLSVRYEDLLTKTATEMRRVCEFLDIDYHQKMDSPGYALEDLGAAVGIRALLKDNTKKYRDNMDISTRNKIESISWPTMENWGYEHTYSGPVVRVSIPMLATYRVYDAFRLMVYYVKKSGFNRGLSIVDKLYRYSANRQITD